MLFKNSDWIWCSATCASDEYGEFFFDFTAMGNEKLTFRISCDGDYTLFVNSKYAASNQYGDFEHYKIYDELDISSYVIRGRNTVSVLVWHPGEESSRYKKADAGLIFELCDGEKVLCSSDENTLARKSPAYECGRCGMITRQLGFGFHYDANLDDGHIFTGEGFGRAVTIEKKCVFYERPIKKLVLGNEKQPLYSKSDDGGLHFLIDMGEETVGLLRLRFFSEVAQKIRVDWGEDLDDGHVRRIIGERVFSVDYTAKPGKNDYTNYMLRFGGRYLELWAEKPIDLEYAAILPQYYPTKERSVSISNREDKEIYELCLNTLRLCMMEHYVDCPWREQALYAYDSRNQMLAGYYAFEDKNADYARSNLKLISMDRRPGGLLSICYPTGKTLAIPSFSLHFITAVYEYYENTGDTSLLSEVYPKLVEIADNFTNRLENGLIRNFKDETHWNFYDWSEHLDGSKKDEQAITCDSITNMLYVIATEKLEIISQILGKNFSYKGVAELVKEKVRDVFFNVDDGLFSFSIGAKDYTELANSLAVISGIANGSLSEKICKKITEGFVSESSLSLKCFMYDALLKTSAEYKDYILKDIRKNYGYMLSCGATAAWETIDGASAFGNAGSLCHGWSAMPIYYYHNFNMT